ncbi:IS30 family transposase [Fusibacter sp. JL216-2]|uniref:IS30 family transposase n=1 Tax=Fusibacter sp. JL216-2 TaxID=3071453 RepID=UPI003D32B3F9
MSVKHRAKGKHLTLDDRIFIEDSLKHHMSLKDIAKKLEKDPTTISKEIKKNRVFKLSGYEFEGGCVNWDACKKKHLCSNGCNQFCKLCTTHHCMRICSDFKTKSCATIKKFPHVCNGCESKRHCTLNRYRYSAKQADAIYREKLESSRQGINMTPSELKKLDDLVTPLVLKGQPISHIYANHKEEMDCSERTLYNYIDMNILTTRNIDLKRKCKYKKRKKKPVAKRKSNHRATRSYEDFLEYIAENPDTDIVELDTVEGAKGGKVIMTLFFRRSSMMFGFLLDNCTQECVLEVFNSFYDSVGHDVFKNNIPLLLTDNGSEFLMPDALEIGKNGEKRTKVFYCDPNASYQKGRLEKNHEFIRYVLPKGKSFDFLTQSKVTNLMNHINSVSRKRLNGMTPFSLGKILLDRTLLDTLSIKEIPADEVKLTEDLVDPTYIKRTLLEDLGK